MKKTKINFNEIPRFIDLSGEDSTPENRSLVLANGIFKGVTTVELSTQLDPIVKALSRGEDVYVTDDEMKVMSEILAQIKLYVPWCQKMILDYLNNKID